MIIQHEFNDPSQTELEDALLANNGFSGITKTPDEISYRLDGTDPIDAEFSARMVQGFSLTEYPKEISLD